MLIVQRALAVGQLHAQHNRSRFQVDACQSANVLILFMTGYGVRLAMYSKRYILRVDYGCWTFGYSRDGCDACYDLDPATAGGLAH